MQRLLIASCVLACVSSAIAQDAFQPIVSIGQGATVIGPVTVRNTNGEIVLDVPDDGYIIIDKLGSEINVGNFAPDKH